MSAYDALPWLILLLCCGAVGVVVSFMRMRDAIAKAIDERPDSTGQKV